MAKRTLKCTIKDLEEFFNESTGQDRVIVSVEFTDSKGSWVQGIDMPRPEHRMSLEALLTLIKSQKYIKIQRPKDPLNALRDAIDKPHEIELS